MKFKEIPHGEFEHITARDLRAEGDFPMTYAELKEKHFPVSAFEADQVCRRSVWPVPGERLPISLVQANFIQGGLILTWCIFHMAGDGTSFYTWSQIWAEECRRAQGLEITEPFHLTAEVFSDRERLKKPSGNATGSLEDHAEYMHLPCKTSIVFLLLVHQETLTILHSHANGRTAQDALQSPPRPSVLLFALRSRCPQNRSVALPSQRRLAQAAMDLDQ